MTNGSDYSWFKVYRRFEDSPLREDSDLVHLFLLCLCWARWQDDPSVAHIGGLDVTVHKGQFITGCDALYNSFYPIRNGKRVGRKGRRLCRRTLWKRLQTLEKHGFLTINPTNKFTVVSVVNWQRYQNENGSLGPSLHTDLHTDCIQTARKLHSNCIQTATSLRSIESVQLKETAASLSESENREPAAAAVNDAAVFFEDEDATATTATETEADMDGTQGSLPGMADVRFTSRLEHACIDTFGQLPSDWVGWAADARQRHDADTIIRALAATKKGKGRTLAFTQAILANWEAQGEPRPGQADATPIMHRHAPPTAEQVNAAEIRVVAYEIIDEWQAEVARGGVWVALWKGPDKAMGAVSARFDLVAACGCAPSAAALRHAWGAFRNAEHTNPVRWSEFAETMRSRLGWDPK